MNPLKQLVYDMSPQGYNSNLFLPIPSPFINEIHVIQYANHPNIKAVHYYSMINRDDHLNYKYPLSDDSDKTKPGECYLSKDHIYLYDEAISSSYPSKVIITYNENESS